MASPHSYISYRYTPPSNDACLSLIGQRPSPFAIHSTPAYPMWPSKLQLGAGGRSHTSLQPCMCGRYRAQCGQHNLPGRNGSQITPAAAAHTSQYEATSHMPSPLLHPPKGQHSVFPPLLRLVTLHQPRTPQSPYKTARSLLQCNSQRTPLEDVGPSRNRLMGCTLVSRGCSESLKGVDHSMIHRMGPTLVYRGCGESLEGVDPSRIHGMGCTLV